MKTKTKIGKQLERKTDTLLVETIIASKKNKAWNPIAAILSGPRRNRLNINIGNISRVGKEGEVLAVPGKVLSQGELKKKMKIIAFAFSESAKKKILDARGETELIINEIKKNPDARGVRILTGQ